MTTERGGRRRPAAPAADVLAGMEVVDNNGRLIGAVTRVDRGHLRVGKPGASREVLVPMNAVERTEGKVVRLRVAGDLLDMVRTPEAPGSARAGAETVEHAVAPQPANEARATARPPGPPPEDMPSGGRRFAADAPAGPAGIGPAPSDPVPADASVRMQRVEERLRADVTQRQAGTVRVWKEVVEEDATLEVPIVQDEVHVERRTVDRPLGDEAPVTTMGSTTRVLVIEERLEVRRIPWVVEEIELTRGMRREVRKVSGKVRKERLHVDTQGEIRIGGEEA
ncbi:MAG: DUF2382 domain-containing protein [Chloroflexota bacterium]|nr:DUF2382 domain-containing protein [Chloroflexota bacterium]